MKNTALSVLGLSILSNAFAPFAAHAELQPLADFLKQGRKNSTQAKVAATNVDAKKAEKSSQRGKLLPTASVSFGYTYNPNPISQDIVTTDNSDPNNPVMNTNKIVFLPRNQFDFIVNARMPIIDFEALHRYRAAKAGVEMAEQEKRAIIAEKVDTEVVKYYFSTYVNGAQLTFAGERLTRLNELMATVRQKEANGSAREFEAEEIQIEIQKIEKHIRELNAAIDAGSDVLFTLTQLKVDLKGIDQLSFEETTYDEGAIDDWFSMINNLPGVRGAEFGVQVADQNVAAARSRYYPKVNVVATDRYTNAAGLVTLTGQNGVDGGGNPVMGNPTGVQVQNNMWSVGVVASVDFDFSKGSDHDLAKANRKMAKYKVDEERAKAKDAIRTAFNTVEKQKSEFEIARDTARLSKKKSTLARQKYNSGLGTLQDLIAADDRYYVQTQEKYAAYGAYIVARANLRVLVGQDIAKVITVVQRAENADDYQLIGGANSIRKLK